jgi:surfeit locus 1 family protein
MTATSDWRRSRWIVLLAALATALLTGRLGVWQLDRAAQKNALHEAQLQQRALPPVSAAELPATLEQAPLHRRVRLEGRWSPAHTVYLENRQMNGRPGFFALTPLLLDDGRAIAVQRGWLPRDQVDRTRIVAAPPPEGRVALDGRIAPPPARLVQFDGAGAGPIRQNLPLADFARETGLPLLPYTALQEDGPADGAGAARGAGRAGADGLLRQWPQPAVDVHKHYGYAFQWFALCALVIGLYVWFQLVKPRLGRQRR